MVSLATKKRIAKLETAHGIGDGPKELLWTDVLFAGTEHDTPAARSRRERHPVYWETTATALEWQAALLDLAADPSAPEAERDRARRLLTEIGDPATAQELRVKAAKCRAEADLLAT